jgi:tetratricopeptide (TPR) repeat protein
MNLEDLKDRAKTEFKNRNFESASELYSEAIRQYKSYTHNHEGFYCYLSRSFEDLSILYNNRGLCWFKIRQYNSALEDAEESIKHNPKHAKV